MELPDPIVPRASLLRNPDRAATQVSPGGRFLAFLGDVEGCLNLWLAPLHSPRDARPLTYLTRRGIHSFAWLFDDRHIVYPRDEEGAENWHIDGIDVETGETRDLTPFPNVSARLIRTSPTAPHSVLLGLNHRNPAIHDLYEADVRSGHLTLRHENPGYLRHVVDGENRLRFAVRLLPDGVTEYLHETSPGAWETFLSVPFEDQLTTSVEGFDNRTNSVYLRDSRGRDLSVLTRVDLATGATEVLAAHPSADLGTVLFHPQTAALQAVTFYSARSEWRCFDAATERAYQTLRNVDEGDLSVVSRTADDSVWIVSAVHGDRPTETYVYRHSTGAVDDLFPNFTHFREERFSRLTPVLIEARDGPPLISYLQLPRWTDPQGTGRPANPLPLLILVHGGPWSRDAWGFNPSSQWLANRGYATLSVNFRGSHGFGKTFLNAGNREWGAKMQDDLQDAAQWAIREGIADSRRIAIMGSSYGGYAALAGLSFTPESYCCAVDICGPSNLITFLESAPVSWQPIVEMLAARIGDVRTAEGRELLRQRSPLMHASRISKPLLIFHGEQDPRVPRVESDQIANALRDAGIPVVYCVFPDEGHGILRPANAQAFAAICEAFLSRFLGGRREPAGDALAKSSGVIVEGAELLAGYL